MHFELSDKFKSSAWSWGIVGLLLIVIAHFVRSLVMGDSSITTWRMLKEKEKELTAELQEVNKKRIALSKEIRLLHTDQSYVEKIIRNRLNFVRQGEILYIFDNENGANSQTNGTSNGK